MLSNDKSPDSTSLAIFPKINGTTIKKEKRAALVLSTPKSTDVDMVAPGYRRLQLNSDGTVDTEVSRVKGIDFEVQQGELVAIMGSSGSGKSTLLNILGMLDVLDEGSYTLDDVLIKDLDETKAAKYRNKFLGFVFQSFNLINYKTAIENVSLPLYYQGIARKERQEEALKYLTMVGLAEWATHLPSELSGGQKQRVAIARAMASKPKVLLADEPTGALDTTTSYEVMDLIQKINEEGNTILVVTHEEDIAKMCKRIVKLKDGVIVEDKKVKQVIAANYV